MRLDDVLNVLGGNRDYLMLGLAVLVLVEGAIIVLWARRAVRLRRELEKALGAAESARLAAERVVADTRKEREVYSAPRATQSALSAPPMSSGPSLAAAPAALPSSLATPRWTPPREPVAAP